MSVAVGKRVRYSVAFSLPSSSDDVLVDRSALALRTLHLIRWLRCDPCIKVDSWKDDVNMFLQMGRDRV